MVSGGLSGILFDIGGVLVGLDGVPSLARLLQIEPLHDEIHRRWMACPSVIRHETGQIAADQFAIEVLQDLGLSLSPEAFLAEFARWLTAPLPGAFELVARIPSAYQVASRHRIAGSDPFKKGYRPGTAGASVAETRRPSEP